MARLTVGLDIGTSGVRAAEIDTSKSTPVLLTYGQVGLPPGSLVDGEIRDASSVTEAIQKLWKNGQFSGSSVIVGIAGLRAITREIDLPYVPTTRSTAPSASSPKRSSPSRRSRPCCPRRSSPTTPTTRAGACAACSWPPPTSTSSTA